MEGTSVLTDQISIDLMDLFDFSQYFSVHSSLLAQIDFLWILKIPSYLTEVISVSNPSASDLNLQTKTSPWNSLQVH